MQAEKVLNEELATKSLELLGWLENAVKSTANFTAEQTPLYINELLTYNFYASLIPFIAWSLVILTIIILASTVQRKWCKKVAKDTYDDFVYMTYLIPFVFCAVFTVPLKDNTDWFKIKVAPRVYVMEYLKAQIKN